MGSLASRQADEMDRLTLAIASGQGIAFGGKEAYEAWQRARDNRGQPIQRDPNHNTGAVARLQAWNWQGQKPRIREH